MPHARRLDIAEESVVGRIDAQIILVSNMGITSGVVVVAAEQLEQVKHPQ